MAAGNASSASSGQLGIRTEDFIGTEVWAGRMTVDEAIAEFRANRVAVYAPMNLQPGTETWQEIEERGAGSSLFSQLASAGMTQAQGEVIGLEVERARREGRTIQKVFGWE